MNRNPLFIAIFLASAFLLLGCTGSAPPTNSGENLGSQPSLKLCYGMGCMMQTMPPSSKGQEYGPSKFAEEAPSGAISIPNNGNFTMDANIIRKSLYGKVQFLYGYNSQIPGPRLVVRQGSNITINFKNNLDMPTTVHWHGIRLENQNDGVPGITQEEVAPGGTFTYNLTFPDEGVYWYHPHVREDIQQERGLYGLIFAEPENAGYFNNVSKEEAVVLDDVLIGTSGSLFPFSDDYTDFAAMGRFGNKPLINGKENYSTTIKAGQALRFYFLNSANVRPFNVSIQGAKFKMIGADSGKFEREFFSDSIVIAPSERYIAEVAFDRPGKYGIYNSNQFSRHLLGEISVEGDAPLPDDFLKLHSNPEISASIDPYRSMFDSPPDFIYNLTIDIPGATIGMGDMMEHAEDGIEWEDTMFGMNAISTNNTLEWRIVDAKTGKKNMDASNSVPVGRPFKIKLSNDKDSLHPMQHPIHLHGARFLVLSKDGVKNSNLAWKDTVLIPIGSTVELLSYFPNEGEWMLHCHIAEHLSSGMMTSFRAA